MIESSFWIAIGSALGGLARFWVAEGFASWLGTDFPWGTIFANISGCFVIGFFATLTGPGGRVLTSPITRQFVMIGLCGGYTTFSSFGLQTLNMAQEGRWNRASLNAAGSVVICLLAVWSGAIMAAALNQLKGAEP